MKINELKPNMKNVTLEEVEIKEKTPAKNFSRMGKQGKVGQARIEDGTGTASLTLWDEQNDNYEVGDKIRVEGAKTTEWQGNMQVSTTFNGRIEKV